MHTSEDDYLISTLRFVSANESTQIFGAILHECLTSPVMKESKAYKTYLGYAIGAVPPKIARKFKKSSPSKKDSDLVLVNKEPIPKGKRIKRSVKKSSSKPATGFFIREPPKETKSKRKKRFFALEKDVAELKKNPLHTQDNPEGDDYPFDLSKPLPLITRGNHQSVQDQFFINNDLKYLQGGISTMTYTTPTTKTKEEIVVRRADNTLYKFKEGDFPLLRINDIEDMLLLVVTPPNWVAAEY
nr:hypothetical protein [Tanacetum cinerariifolium]